MSDFKISGGDAVVGLKNSVSIFPWLFFFRNVMCLIQLAESLHWMCYCLHLPDYLSLGFLSVGFMSLDFIWQRTLPPGKKWRSKAPSGICPVFRLRERVPVWRAVRLRQMQWHLENNLNYQRTMDIGWLEKLSPLHLLSAPIDHWSSFLQRGALPSPTGLERWGWQPGCVASKKQ